MGDEYWDTVVRGSIGEKRASRFLSSSTENCPVFVFAPCLLCHRYGTCGRVRTTVKQLKNVNALNYVVVSVCVRVKDCTVCVWCFDSITHSLTVSRTEFGLQLDAVGM
ncbi:unnamed protein product [Enterobius vermicularis]|uniref:Uncharacterized protein n=1 Tax=Enterobius vermicularis TaxID=51028 RepID=A0A0N4V154_ENTVE|nr:unnamed protein product [Enterobius vermicularis]